MTREPVWTCIVCPYMNSGPVCTHCGWVPLCANCSKPATCIGAYEGMPCGEFACNDCCGHGCEGGHCEYLLPLSEEAHELET